MSKLQKMSIECPKKPRSDLSKDSQGKYLSGPQSETAIACLCNSSILIMLI